jgi:hypothetical protein
MDWYLAGYAVGGAIIGAVELTALFRRRPGTTLSEHWWRWVGIGRPWTVAFAVRRILLGAALAWLFVHLTFGWITLSKPLPWR